MATAGRAEDLDLNRSLMEDVLREDACSFEFFQAVTLLQRLRHELPTGWPVFNPEDEAVHFSVNNELAFPASQIQEIDGRDDSRRR